MTTRERAIEIFTAAVAAVQPARLIPAHLFIEAGTLHILGQSLSIKNLGNVYVIGAGKASAAMAQSVESILGNLLTEGLVVTKYGHALPLEKVQCPEAGHPVPDEQGLAATAKTLDLVKQAGQNDLVICLISGGASSLWIDLPAGASLIDVQQTFTLLINSGATISEVNTIRKHLSAIKGGQLPEYAPLARWFTLIISDVPADDLSVIASGPTVADAGSFADAKKILEKYGLLKNLPLPILQHINAGIAGTVKETAKPANPVFKQVCNKIIGSNRVALEAAAKRAVELGYVIPFMDSDLNGDAATVGREFARSCLAYAGNLPACFLLGGETTVHVKGSGKGGRNQHMALSALLELDEGARQGHTHRVTFLCAGTDGTDGPTDAAGAIADQQCLSLAQERYIDAQVYLDNNDAYSFFEQTGSLLKTGATQTNVMDLVVVIVE